MSDEARDILKRVAKLVAGFNDAAAEVGKAEEALRVYREQRPAEVGRAIETGKDIPEDQTGSLEAEVARLAERRDAARTALQTASFDAREPVQASTPDVAAAADAEVVKLAVALRRDTEKLRLRAERLRVPLAALSWSERPTTSLNDATPSGVESDFAAVIVTLDKLATPLEVADVG